MHLLIAQFRGTFFLGHAMMKHHSKGGFYAYWRSKRDQK